MLKIKPFIYCLSLIVSLNYAKASYSENEPMDKTSLKRKHYEGPLPPQKKKFANQNIDDSSNISQDTVFEVTETRIFEGFEFEYKPHGFIGILTPLNSLEEKPVFENPMKNQRALPKVKGFDKDLCTLLINVKSISDNSSSCGTGFIGYISDLTQSLPLFEKYGRVYPPYNFSWPGFPLLFTNHHVLQKKISDQPEVFVDLKDEDQITLTLRLMKEKIESNEDIKQAKVRVSYKNLKPHIIFSENNVDILAIHLHPLFHDLYTNSPIQGYMPYYYGIDITEALRNSLKNLQTGSSVQLYGYPYGLYDEGNYLPIARFGHCACNPQIQNRERFIVDIASFPGQSGAPVFFVKENLVMASNDKETGRQNFEYITYCNLIGIFSSGYLPNKSPIHLGEVIKINKFQEFIDKAKSITL